MPKLPCTYEKTKPSARLNLLDRLAQAITPLVATRPVHFIALLGLCAAYIQGGLDKLLDFNAAVAETQSFGLPFAAAATAATIVTELAGSMLILTGIYRWLGALWLAGFTLIATFVANRFWDMHRRSVSWSRTRSSSTSAWSAAFFLSRGSICARAAPLRWEARMLDAKSIGPRRDVDPGRRVMARCRCSSSCSPLLPDWLTR